MTGRESSSIRFGFKLLGLLINQRKNYGLYGDIEEIYHLQHQEIGARKAMIWFWLQIFRAIPPFIYHKFYWTCVMIHNYAKITIRNIKRQKIYTLINLSGLAVGLACSILIMLWVMNELSYDQFHQNINSLYRIESDNVYGDKRIHLPSSPVPLGPVLSQEIPGIKNATRCTRFGGMHIKYKNKIFFEDDIRAVDKEFFEMFSFPLQKGDPSNILSNPFSLILTEETANKYFGHENPIGKVVSVENTFDLTITGIIENTSENSSIQFDGLVNFEFVQNQLERMPRGWGNAIMTFVQLNSSLPPENIADKITQFVDKQFDGGIQKYQLNPLSKIHLHSSFGSNAGSGLIRYVFIFALIALFVLLIAIINFVNLSTARSANRLKEVGMRKVVGALRGQIILQFLGESIILSLLALLIAIIIVLFTLPLFNQLALKNITFEDLLNLKIIVGIVLTTVGTGLVAGCFPSIYISSFKTVNVLQSQNFKLKKNSIRKILVIFQFVTSITLIIATNIVTQQVDYMRGTNVGYKRDGVVRIRMTGETPKRYPIIRQELLNLPGVLAVTACGRRPTLNSDHGENISWTGKDPTKDINVIFHTVDFDYIENLEIKVIKGRSFSRDISSDTSNAFMINEKLANLIGEDKVIGKLFSIFWMKGPIIGVFKDIHHLPLRHEIEPMVMLIAPNPYWLSTLIINVHSHNIDDTIELIEKKWKEIVPDYPFDYAFVHNDYLGMYRIENRLMKLLHLFAGLAIFIAFLGLFGLSSYTVEQRTKQIGIRKVLGASLTELTFGLSKEMLYWVGIANIIAWPLAWFIMQRWLQDFAFRIDFTVWPFILAGGAALFIAILAVSYQSVRAAAKNPVNTLRYE